MEEETGGDPIFLVPCEVDSVTRTSQRAVCPARDRARHPGRRQPDDVQQHLVRRQRRPLPRRLADGTIIYIDPPAAPTNAAATPTPFGAKVTWKAPTVTNGAAVTGYVVTAIHGGVVKKTVTLNRGAHDDRHGPDCRYDVRVPSGGEKRCRTRSPVGHLQSRQADQPARGTDRCYRHRGAGQATVRWTAPTVTNSPQEIPVLILIDDASGYQPDQ